MASSQTHRLTQHPPSLPGCPMPAAPEPLAPEGRWFQPAVRAGTYRQDAPESSRQVRHAARRAVARAERRKRATAGRRATGKEASQRHEDALETKLSAASASASGKTVPETPGASLHPRLPTLGTPACASSSARRGTRAAQTGQSGGRAAARTEAV